MRVLVTRPEPDAGTTAEDLRALGHEPVIEPLFDIVATGAAMPEGGFDAVIVTSRNALRTISPQALAALRAKPAFAVGGASARAARQAGFADVRSAEGDATRLAALILADGRIGRGARLLHPCGADRAGGLEEPLVAAGLTYLPWPVYESRARPALTPSTARLLADGGIGAVLLFSPRATRHFVALAAEIRFAAGPPALHVISENAALPAAGLAGWTIRIAGEPTGAALLATLPA
ncbi:MAG: uroporphyrinogen-III synthase [Flavobacteriaceae bacterium]